MLFSPILGYNVTLSLLYRSHVDTWWGVWVQPEFIILTSSVGDTYHPLSFHQPTSCLDLTKDKDSTGPNFVICSLTYDEVLWQYTHSILPHNNHWFGFPALFHLYTRNIGLFYKFNHIYFISVWHFSTCKEILVVCTLFYWGEVEEVSLLETFLGECCGWKFEIFQCFNKDRINVGQCKLEGSMVIYPVHYCITIKIDGHHVWTVIVWLDMHRIAWV